MCSSDLTSDPTTTAGTLVSSRAPDRYLRPVITFAIFASGLKYVGVGTQALGWALVGVLAAGALVWAVVTRPWEPSTGLPAATDDPVESISR